MKKYLFLFSLLLLFSLFSCKKDTVKIIDFDHVANTWILEEYLKNGNDQTSEITLQQLKYKIEDFDFYGFSFWYADNSAGQDSLTGSTYGINKEENLMSFYYAHHLIPVSNEFSITQSMDFRITKLNSKELWFEQKINKNTFEMRFKAK